MKIKRNDKQEILALTGLRFVAAFYVFIFHIHLRWVLSDVSFVKNVLAQGAVGMSIFFMLSGFVLAYVYGDGKTSYKDYLVNRFSRIYPIYIFAAIITIPYIGITVANNSIHEISMATLQGIFLIIANIFVIQAWIPQFFGSFDFQVGKKC